MDRSTLKKARGFTLIELMVTVAVIGLGLTIVFFQIDTFLPATRLQAACRKLVSDMDNLRLSSIMVYKLPVHLEYDLQRQGYRAYLPYEMDEGAHILGPGQTDLLEFRELPESIVFEQIFLGPKSGAMQEKDLVTVLINPDGSVTGHIVQFKDEHYGRIYSMRIASLTGFAEVLDHQVEYEEIDESSF